MGFTVQYVKAVNSKDLQDDPHHRATEALIASAFADIGGGKLLGSLLCRVKFADGTIHKDFESGSSNLAQLVKHWAAAVREKGRSRGWMKIKTEWDIAAAESLYKRVAYASMESWLDGRCTTCHGAGVNEARRACACCAGSGKQAIKGGRYEVELIRDLISELEGVFQAHGGRAAALMRRAA